MTKPTPLETAQIFVKHEVAARSELKEVCQAFISQAAELKEAREVIEALLTGPSQYTHDRAREYISKYGDKK